ncbi:glycoside hydrolase family 3 protein [Bowmanella yangjiangensis]|uniref:Glycoside hydrolase family 3 C-terminal domain-containing protein n=1 Tax=Bowmanella yangjiangensis TaxID=2811230 RepID=A0ABS3CX83_9ALTE|nr:glycoside hydrolase family 3 N-terminal domain-containing protein [Bowmanella yangjiangensis]MBN7821734.1 glycoside hydrolase family 3 C-terminal domain-containing protein [Bowmanella yangjiangensis]
MIRTLPISLPLLTLSALLMSCTDNEPQQNAVETAVPDYWPVIRSEVVASTEIETRVKTLLASMTIEQKVAQTMQPEIRDISVEDMRRYGFGSYLNGGGAFPNNNKHASVQDWVKLAEAMYQASVDDSLDGSRIPTMWGTDAVHGHNNVIGATLFPHNIGLGATRNPALIEQIAEATAKEVAATGIDWIFAPTVAVTRDDRWGRTYEAYSEDPDIVRDYAYAIVKGLQGRGNDFLSEQHVISTVKHFLGDGGTQGGDDQGDNLATERELFDIHAQGYIGGLTAGAQSVMASFNSWHGVKNHGNPYLLTQVLKQRMGFDGFVVGDWNGHGQIPGCSNESCPDALNAGLDMYMVPTQAWKPLLENTIAQVKSGQISTQRLDDAVARILRVKLRAGLFDKPSPAQRALAAKQNLIGHPAHRAVARQAVRESLVLLKNHHQLLPLDPRAHILLAGDGANNIGKQSGGWTITWQGTGNQNGDFPGATSIYDGFKQAMQAAGGKVTLSQDGSFTQRPDVAVVVFGEEPYAEGNGDLANLEYQRGNKTDLALLSKLKAQGIPVVAVFLSGRPLWVNPELNAADAFVAAWLPGSEGVGIADVLLKKADGTVNYDFKGKLSFSWPATPEQTTVNRHDADYQPLLPYGFGLRYGDAEVLAPHLNETLSAANSDLSPLVLFENNIKAPWQLSIGEVGHTQAVVSSVQQQGPVSLRTSDWKIQEDSRLLRFDGSATGEIQIGAAFPQDLRTYLESGAVLNLTVKLGSPAQAEVRLAMLCGEGCRAELDISDKLAQLPTGQWHQLSFALACFAEAEQLARVFSPFSLQVKGELDISLADIRLQPGVTAPQQCLK